MRLKVTLGGPKALEKALCYLGKADPHMVVRVSTILSTIVTIICKRLDICYDC